MKRRCRAHEASGIEADNRKAKRWGFRSHSIEPASAMLGDLGCQIEQAGRSGRTCKGDSGSQNELAGRALAIRGAKTSWQGLQGRFGQQNRAGRALRQGAQGRFGQPKRVGRARSGDSACQNEQAERAQKRFGQPNRVSLHRAMLFEQVDRACQVVLSTGPCFSRPGRTVLSTGACFSSARARKLVGFLQQFRYRYLYTYP